MTSAPDLYRRIDFLDGLRGLSIFLVVIWHFFGPPDGPFLGVSQGFSSNIVVWNGWAGVQMFFLISGFVIFMSLERCDGFLQFILKRWIRLWPTMLIATIAISAFLVLLKLPSPHPFAPLDVIPGLIFINPAVLHAVIHIPIDSLDGPFWSLYTEVAFYVLAGILFFRLGWIPTVAALVGIAIFTTFARPVMIAIHTPAQILRAVEPFEWLHVDMWGWFASGALFWKASECRNPKYFLLAVLIGVGSAWAAKLASSDINKIALVLVVLTFAAAQKYTAVQRLLSTRLFNFFGYISYPLYLIHQNIGLSLIRRTEVQWPEAPPLLAVAPAFVAVVLLAWAIAAIFEPPVKSVIGGYVTRNFQVMRGSRAVLPPREPVKGPL